MVVRRPRRCAGLPVPWRTASRASLCLVGSWKKGEICGTPPRPPCLHHGLERKTGRRVLLGVVWRCLVGLVDPGGDHGGGVVEHCAPPSSLPPSLLQRALLLCACACCCRVVAWEGELGTLLVLRRPGGHSLPRCVLWGVGAMMKVLGPLAHVRCLGMRNVKTNPGKPTALLYACGLSGKVARWPLCFARGGGPKLPLSLCTGGKGRGRGGAKNTRRRGGVMRTQVNRS